MSTYAHIGLGSNLGKPKAHLDDALEALADTPGIVVRAVSAYHETAPIGGPGGQAPFQNAAAKLETTLEPLELLQVLLSIEQKAGRVRTVRWGERPLDLDLLLFGDRVIHTGAVVNRAFGGTATVLEVPHPRMAVRRFVLAPLAEIAPAAVDPMTGRAVSELLANLDRRPSYVAIHDPGSVLGASFCERLVHDLGADEILSGPRIPRSQTELAKVKHRNDQVRARFESRFEQHVRALDLTRWTDPKVRDRWLVTRFCFDDYLDAPFVFAQDRSSFRQRVLDARRRVLPPTFVVEPLLTSPRRSFSSASSRTSPPFGDLPILEVSPGDPEAAAAEVLAACAASRVGR